MSSSSCTSVPEIPVYMTPESIEHWLAHVFKSNTAEVDGSVDGLVEGTDSIPHRVASIIQQVRQEGDKALLRLIETFQDAPLVCYELGEGEWPLPLQELLAGVSLEVQQTLEYAARNIRAFAQKVAEPARSGVTLTHDGFSVGLDWKPVERVACYAPAGRYPLASTVLMTAITAQVARVPHITVVTPRFAPEILYAAQLAGVHRLVQLGGAQAVAALTYGTHTIAPVDMIVGPGNAYVAEAKKQLQGTVGIDMLAGPSEVVVIADEHADATAVALELLAQAEHDPDATAYLLCTDRALIEKVRQAVQEQFAQLNLPSFVLQALAGSALVYQENIQQAVALANRLAPEHLVLHVCEPEALKPHLSQYGTLFMGNACTVPFGDYAAGPNHTLPTHRTARFSGALNPYTFLRAQGWVNVSPPCEPLAQMTARFAGIENLKAHQAAALYRLL